METQPKIVSTKIQAETIDKVISIEMVRKIKYHFFRLHDTGVNQKYAKSLPYSFHLNSVKEQLFKIRKIMFIEWGITFNDTKNETTFHDNKYLEVNNMFSLLIICCYTHDALENCNITYNDLVKLLMSYGLNEKQSIFVADIVYCVSDEKGKSREERRSDKYYDELFENENAYLIKLADMLANALHTVTFNHESCENKLNEFIRFSQKTPATLQVKYRPVTKYLENLLGTHLQLDIDSGNVYNRLSGN